MRPMLDALWDEVLAAGPDGAGIALCRSLVERLSVAVATQYVWDGRRWLLRAASGESSQDAPRVLTHAAPRGRRRPGAARPGPSGDVWTAFAWGVHVALRLGPGKDGSTVAIAPEDGERLHHALQLAACAEAHLRRGRWIDPDRDPVTGLLSGAAFARRLQEEVARALRLRQPVALVRISVRGLGIATGEREGFEGEVARILREVTRTGDVSGRESPEEFALILPGSDASGAERVAVRAAARIRLAGQAATPAIQVNVSAGVCDLPADAEDARGLRAAADRALYLAETSGGDCVRVSQAGG